MDQTVDDSSKEIAIYQVAALQIKKAENALERIQIEQRSGILECCTCFCPD